MAVIRTRSKESLIYHKAGCRYIRQMKSENRKDVRAKDIEKGNLIPCKCCNTMDFLYNIEKKVIKRKMVKYDMLYRYERSELFIRTRISCWKLAYIPAIGQISLYHRNASSRPIDFEHPWKERYHKQKDHYLFPEIDDCIEYIAAHDIFKSSVEEGKVPTICRTKKERKAAHSAIRKYQDRRIDYLFRSIERGNQEYVRYSIY